MKINFETNQFMKMNILKSLKNKEHLSHEILLHNRFQSSLINIIARGIFVYLQFYDLDLDFSVPLHSRENMMQPSYTVEDANGELRTVQMLKPTFCLKVRTKISKYICNCILLTISAGLFTMVIYFFVWLVYLKDLP